MRLADALRNAGDLDRAASILRDGLSRWPHSLAGRVSLARVYVSAGERDAALDELSQVLGRSPDHWAALDLLAQLLREAGDIAGSVEALARLARGLPGDREVERRLDGARAALLHRPALPSRAPDAEAIDSASATTLQSAPTRVMPSAPFLGAGPPAPARTRVSTVPSAARPLRPGVRSTDPEVDVAQLLRRAAIVATAPGARQAQPGIPRLSRGPEPVDPFLNETMVELLVSQGQTAEARRLLGDLLAREPSRRSLAQRLKELGGSERADEHVERRPSPSELESLMGALLTSAAADLAALVDGQQEQP